MFKKQSKIKQMQKQRTKVDKCLKIQHYKRVASTSSAESTRKTSYKNNAKYQSHHIATTL